MATESTETTEKKPRVVRSIAERNAEVRKSALAKLDKLTERRARALETLRGIDREIDAHCVEMGKAGFELPERELTPAYDPAAEKADDEIPFGGSDRSGPGAP